MKLVFTHDFAPPELIRQRSDRPLTEQTISPRSGGFKLPRSKPTTLAVSARRHGIIERKPKKALWFAGFLRQREIRADGFSLPGALVFRTSAGASREETEKGVVVRRFFASARFVPPTSLCPAALVFRTFAGASTPPSRALSRKCSETLCRLAEPGLFHHRESP